MTIGCSVKKSTALRLERSWVQLARSSLKKFWCIGSSATALNKSVHKTTYDYINILQEVYIPVLMWLKFMKIWGWINHGKVIIHTFFSEESNFQLKATLPHSFLGSAIKNSKTTHEVCHLQGPSAVAKNLCKTSWRLVPCWRLKVEGCSFWQFLVNLFW